MFRLLKSLTPWRCPALSLLVCGVDDCCQEYEPEWQRKQLDTSQSDRLYCTEQTEIVSCLLHPPIIEHNAQALAQTADF